MGQQISQRARAMLPHCAAGKEAATLLAAMRREGWPDPENGDRRYVPCHWVGSGACSTLVRGNIATGAVEGVTAPCPLAE